MSQRSTPTVAYLTGVFPAMSHTFILREASALRAMGMKVLTCSIRRPTPSQITGAPERAALEETFYVLDNAKKLSSLFRAHFSAMARPGRYLSTLWLALRTGRPGARGMLYQLFYFAEAAVLARHLRQEGVTHLHNHFADSSANVALLASNLSGIPFSYALHGPAELFEPRSWHLETKTAQASFVTCISYFCRSQAMYFSDPEDWIKLRIVHCGITPELYDCPPRQAGDGMDLLFVGRLTAIKGVRVLLEAFAQAQSECPGLRLTLVGEGEDRKTLEDLARPFGASVQFVGARSQTEVAEHLAKADVFVLPSFAEGLPVVLMEAMASARPVITSQLAGVNELVEDGVSGFIVPASDVDSFAARIVTLYQDPERRNRMGRAGRAKVCAEFDINDEAARLARLIQQGPGAEVRPVPLSFAHGGGT